MASDTAALSVGSILKDSAMQLTATSMDSWSSAGSVPSVTELVRKSQMASARRCLDVVVWQEWKISGAFFAENFRRSG